MAKCINCGRRLSRVAHTEFEDTDKWRSRRKTCNYILCFEDRECGALIEWEPEHGCAAGKCSRCEALYSDKRVRRVKSRTYRYDKPGPYGDGFFCSLSCGHVFGVAAAKAGVRLKEVDDA